VENKSKEKKRSIEFILNKSIKDEKALDNHTLHTLRLAFSGSLPHRRKLSADSTDITDVSDSQDIEEDTEDVAERV
jgi:hypothetical protein